MTTETSDPIFTCDHCGKRFFWKAEVAGRRGKCTCGAVTRIPLHPPAAPAEPGEAHAAPPPTQPRSPGRSGTHGIVPPAYPTTAADKTGGNNAKTAGVFGGFKRRIFGRKDDGK